MTDFTPPPHCAIEVTNSLMVEDVQPISADPVSSPLTFDDVYAEHADFLFAVLRRLGLDVPTAEDALQDLFVIVHRKLGSFEARGSLRSWLYTIAVRVAREHGRKKSLRRRFFRAFEGLGVEREVDESASTPEEQLETADALRELDRALSKLAVEQRETFVLVEVAGCSVPEVAECLEIPLNTAYSRLRLARKSVRTSLGVR